MSDRIEDAPEFAYEEAGPDVTKFRDEAGNEISWDELRAKTMGKDARKAFKIADTDDSPKSDSEMIDELLERKPVKQPKDAP